MPEGDTILRTAKTLQRAIGGQTVKRFESPRPEIAKRAEYVRGQKISEVVARGKNLLIVFEDGHALRTHMKMTGAWHIYRPGERWQKSPGAARVVIEAGEWVAVCFAAPDLEWVRGDFERAEAIAGLGPDILAEEFDEAEAVRRFAGHADREIGDAIMDQTIVAGIGNIYKSESLFTSAVDPKAKVGALDEETLKKILGAARKQMSASVLGLPSRGRSVYLRSGKPCPACGTTIKMIRQGELLRSTYYCPSCQVVR